MAPAKSSTSKATASTQSSRKAFTPRPPRSAQDRLPNLFRGLTDQVQQGHFGNAIKTCNKILHLDPSSTSASQTLLFLRLQTDDYAAALELVTCPPSRTGPLDFEKAYCLYRLHREKEALEVLETLVSKGRKEQHLEAQIRYRLGEFQRTQDLYDDLLAGVTSSSLEQPDILTNLSATTSQLDFLAHSYRQYLSQPAPPDLSASKQRYIPSEADLESYVPSLPTGWAMGGVDGVKKAIPVNRSAVENQRKKPRHRLPKGAVAGKAFSEDPERWLPLKQRASYIAAQSKKKGASLSMGSGKTQGSTSAQGGSAGGGGGGGGKNKKSKKK